MSSDEPGDQPTMGLQSTAALLERLRGGDRLAADDLCRRFLPRLRRWAHGRVPPGARGLLDTDDLVQNTLRRTLDHMKGFEERREGAFVGYLRTVLLNQIRDAARHAGRRPERGEIESDIPDDRPSPLEAAVGREALERYEAALARLPGEDREAVVLRVELGMGFAEIAEAIGAPSPNAARMRVVRALVRMAEEVR